MPVTFSYSRSASRCRHGVIFFHGYYFGHHPKSTLDLSIETAGSDNSSTFIGQMTHFSVRPKTMTPSDVRAGHNPQTVPVEGADAAEGITKPRHAFFASIKDDPSIKLSLRHRKISKLPQIRRCSREKSQRRMWSCCQIPSTT